MGVVDRFLVFVNYVGIVFRGLLLACIRAGVYDGVIFTLGYIQGCLLCGFRFYFVLG